MIRAPRALLVCCALFAVLVPSASVAGPGLPAPPVPVPVVPGVPGIAGGAIASDNVTLVANIPDIVAIGSKLIGNTLYVNTVQGVRIYDVTYGLPVLMGAIELPHLQNEDIDTNGKILLVASDHFLEVNNTLYVFDVSNGHVPVLLGVLRNLPMAHTATCIQDCKYAWLGGGGGAVGVVDLRNPAAITYLGTFKVPGSVHDVQVDAKGIAWVSTAAGLWGYKPGTYALRPTYVTYGATFHNLFIIHNSLRPYASSWKPVASASTPIQPGELTLVTEENWLSVQNNDCANDGRFQTAAYRQVGTGSSYVHLLDTFHIGEGTAEPTDSTKGAPVLTCSAHYFGYKNYFAAVAWYEQGVRFLDVKDPRNIRQVGYWMPLAGEAWSAQFVKDYVYVFDAARGLDIIRFAPTSRATQLAPFLNAARPGIEPDKRFGFACRIPGAGRA